jgi:uncharacterized protein YndB with AHSA1/START domain
VTSGEASVTIQATPEEVWPWVADVAKHSEWSPKPFSVEWLSGEPNALGSRYRSLGWIPGEKEHSNEGEVVENLPFERFALRSSDKQGSYANTLTLVPVGYATTVTLRLEFLKINGIYALLIPIVFPFVGKASNRKRMSLLKTKVEGSAAPLV